MASTDVVKKETDALPDYLKDFKGNLGKGNIDQSDVVIPRLKLIHPISPEVTAYPGDAKPGGFWHNVLDKNLGEEITFIACSQKKKYFLFAPRGDEQGILARADDGVHWEPPNKKFQVKLKGIKDPVTWATAKTVKESGLAEFGTSNPSDPNSHPAAILIYEYLCYLPDYPEISPVVLSFAKSQIRPCKKELVSKIALFDGPIQALRFQVKSVPDKNDDGDDYFNVTFRQVGYSTDEQFKAARSIFDRFKDYTTADEEGAIKETDATKGSGDVSESEY